MLSLATGRTSLASSRLRPNAGTMAASCAKTPSVPPRAASSSRYETVDLNSSRSDKETIHLELAFDGKAPAYNPGDSLDLYPHNDPDYVEQLLKAAGLQPIVPTTVEGPPKPIVAM